MVTSFEELHHEGTLLVQQQLSWSKATSKGFFFEKACNAQGSKNFASNHCGDTPL